MNDDEQFDDDRTVADLRAVLHALLRRVCERVPVHFLGDEKDIMFGLLTALSFADPKFPALVASLPPHLRRHVYTYIPLGPLPVPDARIH